MFRYCYIFLIFNFIGLTSKDAYSQSSVIDSLNRELVLELNDSLKFELIFLKIKEFRDLNLVDSAIGLNKELYEIATRTNHFELLDKAYVTEFTSVNLTKDYNKAKKVYLDYIKILESEKDTIRLAEVYYNLGAHDHNYGNTAGSLEYLFKSAFYYEFIGNPIKPYRAIGITYSLLSDFKKSTEYNQKVIELAIENKDYEALARAYLSKGYQLKEMNKKMESLIASKKAIDIYINKLNKPTAVRLSLVYGNVAEVYINYHEYCLDSVIYVDSNYKYAKNLDRDVLDSIVFYLDKSIWVSSLSSSKHHLYNAKVRYADYYYYLKEFKKSLKLYEECYLICKNERKMLSNEMGITAKIYQIYKNLNKFDEALKFFELNLILQDSLYSEDKQRAVGKQEAKFEFEKEKAKEDAEREKIKIIENAQLKKQTAIILEQNKKRQIILNSIALGGVLISIFSFFIYRKLKMARVQQKLIESQKQTIEENRNKMLESIAYSKNIQKRIFPTLKEVKKLLPNSFLYIRPKDVVSGDFYWVHQKGNKTYFSVADCTGHGVPGAFMTLISLNLINAIILEEDVNSTSVILERLHVKLRERLTSSEEEQMKHGLDIAMCAFNHDTNELEYSGLHNPIYIINKDNELKEIKGDHLFLGISTNFKVTKHVININSGDTVYMSTDGYPDQKGGDRGKKFYSSRLRNLLRIIDTKPLNERRLILDQKFEVWKGDLEQVDDVCIMGVNF